MTVSKPSWQRLYLAPLALIAVPFAVMFFAAELTTSVQVLNLVTLVAFAAALVAMVPLMRPNREYAAAVARSRGRRPVPMGLLMLAIFFLGVPSGIARALGAPQAVSSTVFVVTVVALAVGLRRWTRSGATS